MQNINVILVSLAILIFPTAVVSGHVNNVCDSVLDYATIFINDKYCRYSPDVNSNSVDMIRRNGYEVKTYNVTTEDGYILTTYRVLDGNGEKVCSQPVFILHGIQSTSEIWVDVGRRSLAFNLVENGYDVWLGNFRGSPHSRSHLKYTTKDPQFWNWSFHEVGLYDVPANLKLIRKEACNCKIIYIGHSMGATSSFVYATLKSDEADEYLAGIVSLAPVVFMSALKTPLKFLAPFRNFIWAFFTLFGRYAILAHPKAQRIIASVTCDKFPLIGFCSLANQLFIGFDYYNEVQAQDLPVMFSYFPQGGGSLKTAIHYLQEIANRGHFNLFDYGERNQQVYGSKSPPSYPLERLKVPVHLFYGERDFLGDPEDARKLYVALRTDKSLVGLPTFNHPSFFYGKSMRTTLYPKLLSKLDTLRKGCGN